MESKFTPGPWSIYTETVHNRSHAAMELSALAQGTENFSGVLPMVLGANGKCTAVTGCGSDGPANARLIAVAPELLEALESIVADHEHCGDNYGDRREVWMLTARTAIAKARGE